MPCRKTAFTSVSRDCLSACSYQVFTVGATCSKNGARLYASEFRPELLEQLRRTASLFTAGSGHYTVLERYGYVWAWYGDPQHAHPDLIPFIPFLPADGGGITYAQAQAALDQMRERDLED